MERKFEQNPGFLKERFPNLAISPEVKRAAKRTEQTKQEQVAKEPEVRIQNYLDRFKEILEREDPEKKKRGINALKKILIDRYVIRVEDIPEAYWKSQLQVLRGRGEQADFQGLEEQQQQEIKQDHLAQTIEDQKGSLEEWVDYLTDENKSGYLPDYLKYWAFAGMLRLERYEKGDKERGIPGRFPERPSGRQRSVKMFPEVNDRALKFLAQAYEAQSKNQSVTFRYDIPEEASKQFPECLSKKDFRTLYGWAQEYLPPISEQEMQITDGQWTMYKQNSDARKLTATLQGKGSGWCIAGEQLAQQYLKAGNLYVYYTNDKQGQSTIPRVVIVEKGNRVTEVRGIEWEENVDSQIKATSIIGDKLKQLPGGTEFEPTDKDTKQLTVIDKKILAGQELTREELVFLYEIERPIKYFGYKKDPRITELHSKRDAKTDLATVFSLPLEQVAASPEQITSATKAYVGKLEFGILKMFPADIKHIYFLDSEARLSSLWIGGQAEKQWQESLQEQKRGKQVNISPYAWHMVKSEDFTKSLYNNTDKSRKQWVLKQKETLMLIRLKVRDLFSDKNAHTTEEIFRRAQDLGLELCPPEVGPALRLQYKDQPMNEWMRIAMKPISGPVRGPSIFSLAHNVDGLWLNYDWADPQDEWGPDGGFVFCLRKSET